MKTTVWIGDLELEVEYTFHDAEIGERDQYGAQLEPDYNAYVEIEGINDEDPDIFCEANDLDKEDIETEVMTEHHGKDFFENWIAPFIDIP